MPWAGSVRFLCLQELPNLSGHSGLHPDPPRLHHPRDVRLCTVCVLSFDAFIHFCLISQKEFLEGTSCVYTFSPSELPQAPSCKIKAQVLKGRGPLCLIAGMAVLKRRVENHSVSPLGKALQVRSCNFPVHMWGHRDQEGPMSLFKGLRALETPASSPSTCSSNRVVCTSAFRKRRGVQRE